MTVSGRWMGLGLVGVLCLSGGLAHAGGYECWAMKLADADCNEHGPIYEVGEPIYVQDGDCYWAGESGPWIPEPWDFRVFLGGGLIPSEWSYEIESDCPPVAELLTPLTPGAYTIVSYVDGSSTTRELMFMVVESGDGDGDGDGDDTAESGSETSTGDEANTGDHEASAGTGCSLVESRSSGLGLVMLVMLGLRTRRRRRGPAPTRPYCE